MSDEDWIARTGWRPIEIDGKPAEVRICYVRAWDDPSWRRINKLPPKKRGRAWSNHSS